MYAAPLHKLLTRVEQIPWLTIQQDSDDASCSKDSDHDDTILANAEALIDTSQSVHSRVSPEHVVSDIPLVVSDIQPTKEMAASEPVSQQRENHVHAVQGWRLTWL